MGFFLLWIVLLRPLSGECQTSQNVRPQPVRLQLKWVPQFQFAGFYAALEKGFYREAGLEVTILPGKSGMDFIGEVVEGRAEYGTEMPDLLLRRIAGAPVVVLAAIFQHSPMVLICRKEAEIRSPHDLVGKRVMMRLASTAELRAMIRREGVGMDQIQMMEHSFDIEDLVQGRVDAMSRYFTDDVHEFQLRGLEVTALHPLHYGVDFYGDCLFTSERELRQNPERVRAFRAASLRGWEYAMKHPEEIAQVIHEKHAPEKSIDSLLAEATGMKPFLLADFVEVGHMNPGRWKHMGDVFVEQGMLPVNYSLKGFL